MPSRLLPLGLLVVVPALAPAQQPADPAKLAAIAPAMQAFVDSGDLAGAVTVVGRKDGVVHHEAVGSRDLGAKDAMQKDTLFRIASMTKPVTAIGIMILADEGKLSPDDDVSKHLPEFTNQMIPIEHFNVDKAGKKTNQRTDLRPSPRQVKLRDLLTHTGGLSEYPVGVDDVYAKRNRTLAETALASALQPLRFEPGTKWAYSNPGIDTLGRVIEVVSGEKYEDFLKKRVFDPLGMTDTAFYPSPEQMKRLAITYDRKKDGPLTPAGFSLIGLPPNPKHPIPAGGLISSGADYAKLCRMMLNKGELDGKRVLSEKAVTEMTRTQTGDIPTGFVDGMSFGYGWAVVKEPKGVTATMSPGTFGHGGAFGTQAWVDPKRDLFVILLIQRTGLPNADGSAFRQKLQELTVAAVEK